MNKKIFIIDGHNLLFRMYYGIPNSIINSKGREIKGLIGFVGAIINICKKYNPYSVIVVFDSESSKNNNIFLEKTYKNNRKDYSTVPENKNPFSQLSSIQKALNYLEIFNIEVEQNEADDYIASIVNNNSYKRFDFIIVSTDSDFIQLVDSRVNLLVQRWKDDNIYDEKLIKSKYEISPENYVLYKSLVGDRCDNIKGIKGIGKITAQNILKYQTILNYIKTSNNKKIVSSLVNNTNVIEKNIKLIKLNDSLDLSDLKFNVLSKQVNNMKVKEIVKIIGEE